MVLPHPLLEPTATRYPDAAVMPCLSCGTPGGQMEEETCFLGGVYCDGQPVGDALLMRLANVGGQLVYQAPYLEPAEERRGEHVYCGLLSPHFGHFIAESLARIWYVRDKPDLTLVWMLPIEYRVDPGYTAWQQEILRILGIRNQALFVREPTRFEWLTVPSAGHVFPNFFAPYYFDALGVVEPKPIIPGKRLYISRSRGHSAGGGYTNEAQLDAYLADAGWSVFHPQDHPVAARFDELSSAEIILLIEGSALLSMLFFREIRSRIFALRRDEAEVGQRSVAFEDFYGPVVLGKSLRFTRLDLPRTLRRGTGPLAWTELDMDAFRGLMEESDFLRHDSARLQKYAAAARWDREAAIRQLERVREGLKTDRAPEQERWYRSGVCEQSGDLDSAIGEMQALLEGGDRGALTYHRLSVLLGRRGDWQGAAAAERSAIDTNRIAIPLLFTRLAEICLRLGELDEAENALRNALAVEATHADALRMLADILLQRGDLDAAEEACRKLSSQGRASAGDHVLASRIAAGRGRRQEAIAEAEAAVHLAEDDAAVRVNLGRSLLIGGDLAGARQHLERAVTLDPAYFPAHLELSKTLAELGDLPAAIGAAEAAVSLAEDNPHLWLNLAHMLVQSREFRRAEPVLEKVLTMAPDLVEAHHQLSILHAEGGDPDTAIDVVETAMRLLPGEESLINRRDELEIALIRHTEEQALAAAAARRRRGPFGWVWRSRDVLRSFVRSLR